MPEPICISTPVGHDDDRVGEVPAHGSNRAVTAPNIDSVAALRQSGVEPSENVVLLVELDLGVEGSGGIDLVLSAWPIVVDSLVGPVVNRVLNAGAAVLAVVSVVPVILGVACMSGGLVRILICLHNIKFWAVFSSDSLGIAVVEAIRGGVVAAVVTVGWGSHKIESCNAPAGHLGHIDVVLD